MKTKLILITLLLSIACFAQNKTKTATKTKAQTAVPNKIVDLKKQTAKKKTQALFNLEISTLKEQNKKALKTCDSLKQVVKDLSTLNNQLKHKNDSIAKENKFLKDTNQTLKSASISFEKTIQFLQQKGILEGYFDKMSDYSEFEEENSFSISFNEPDNDSRAIDFTKIDSSDDIKFNSDKTAIEFKVDGEIRLFNFPKQGKIQVMSDDLKTRILKAFKHIKSLMISNAKLEKDDLFNN
ncbi:MAG: hypothetical protein JST78_09385 [Bacteroidetes bacterium]|nr:hypothetical protein [Bacteroidota bacterium]